MARLEETGFTPPSGGSSFLVGMALGAVVGAAVGLMFARKPGPEFRRDVADTATRLSKKASAAYDEAAHAVTATVGRSRRAWEAGRQAINEASPMEPRADGRTQADGVI
jgi:gas vesicle protein